MENILDALSLVLSVEYLAFILLGSAVGLLVGLLPGMSGVVGISMLLPFIFGMDPGQGIAMLIGFTAVGHTSDTFPSVLIGVPGSGGSQATIMDGYPLAQQGEAARALGAAFFCSMIGGIIGAVALLALVFVARPLVLALGSPELFMLTLFGLSMVGILAKGAPAQGIAAGLLGMLMGAIGGAPATPTYRYTFEWIYLWDGIPLPVLALGLFALPELLGLLQQRRSVADAEKLGGGRLDGVRDVLAHKWLVVRSALLGTGVGMIPGLGGAVTDWIAYGVAKQTVKNSDSFGKGDIRGVIAPESANNAKEGGALVPTLLFGIPGSGTTAVLLGGMVMMGIQTGPRMVTDHLDITLSIVWTLVIANVVATGACFALSKYVARISLVEGAKLAPFLMVILVAAAYQSTGSWGDIIAFLAIGVLGWHMKKGGWPRAPILIGFVLASSSERYLHLSMSRYGLEWLLRPGVLVIGILTIAVVLIGGLQRHRRMEAGELDSASGSAE